MRKRLFGLIIFIAAVAVLVGTLKALNWTPGIIQEGFLARYDSIEDVKSKLHIRDVYAPSYYPQGLHWPPTKIIAQAKPYIMVLMECTRQEDDQPSLIISQTAFPNASPQPAIRIDRMSEHVRYPLKGRAAMLDVGLCQNDESCSRISWDESGYRIEVVMLAPPTEIVKIVESMLPD